MPPTRKRPQLAPSAMPLQPTRSNQYAPIQPSVASKKQSIEPQISPSIASFPQMPQQYYGMVPSMNIPEGVLYTDSPQKRVLPSSQPMMPMNQPLLGMWDSNFQHFDQENYMPLPMPETYVDFPDPSRRVLKRSYSETIPSNDRIVKRLKLDQDEELEIPQPSEMPVIEDDGRKPPYSYAQMIGMAILRAPGRRLTLANIYEWIGSTFQHYREDPKTGWHNSIRHNLSLNKAFIKQERPKSDAGKGCYWMIQPGMELQFFKDKSRKNTGITMGMQQPFSSQPTMQTMPQPVSDAIQPRPWIIQSQSSMEPQRPQTAPVDPLPELDSDATVPASDPDLDDDDVVESKEEVVQIQPSMPPPSSPPVINSSPPVMPRLLHQRTVSSPANITRNSTKPRRSQTAMDDSGYYSSLESSVRRPRAGLPTSDIGFVPSKKLGRAEQEIARIRSSSHDITPSGCRFTNAADAAAEARSSSPTRGSPTKAPITPPVVFKKPALPQSPSPNAQLRAFREQMQAYDSPGKDGNIFNDSGFSPGLKLGTPLFANSFDDFFNDFNPATPLASSPIRNFNLMSAKRSIQRSGILADVTHKSNLKHKTPSKIGGNITLKAPTSIGYSGSPLKKAANTKHVEFLEENDENVNLLFDFGSFPDENEHEPEHSDGEELDISKGFSKIGSNNHGLGFGNLKQIGGGLRPPLARSQTSRF